MIANKLESRGGIFHGWWIVAVSAIGMLFCYISSIGFTFGVFTNPIIEEFGWSLTEVSLAFSLSLIAMCVAMPVVGPLVDRYGAKTVIVPSILVLGLSLASLSFLPDSLLYFYGVYIVAGIAGGGSSTMPYSKVVSHWFDRQRGLALALAAMGAGLGSLIMPPFAQALINGLGWRNAYLVIGATVVVVTIPVVVLWLKERPEDMDLRMDGKSTSEEREIALGTVGTSATASGLTGPEALGTGVFWLLSAGYFLVSSSVMAALIHLAPLLTDRGFSPEMAALVVAVLGGSSLIGGVSSGYLLDRFFAAVVVTGFFLSAAIGLLLLWGLEAGGVPFVAAVLIGLSMGATGEIIPYLTGRYFGLRAFGQIYGYGLISFTLGGVVGPPLMGMAFDSTQSYSVGLLAFGIASLVAAAMVVRLSPYRTWSEEAPPA
ncbi:MAG: MFS transporter [Rhodospirillales bacterium]|nr:MFS transporter [Rhodospirillales bacterium]